MKNNLRSAVAKITQNKRIRAIALEVIGTKASVKISGSSQVLYGLPITGGNITAGQEVYVDYTTGSPVVHSYQEDLSTSSVVTRTKVRTIVPDPDIPVSGNTFVEAPIDHKPYARQDAGWVEITSGSTPTSGSGPLSHEPVEGEYLTGYNAETGTFTSGSPTIGSGSGIEEAPIDGNKYVRQNADWVLPDSPDGNFTSLSDTPDSYSGQGNKIVSVKADESGLEFITAPTGTGEVPSAIKVYMHLNFS